MENRYPKLIPALRELYGLVSSLENVMTEVEYTKGGLMIFTDSLPVILCSIYAKHNSKIARLKLFLESISFLEISYSPGFSNFIKLPRKSTDEPIFKQKIPTDCDRQKCQKINELIDKNYIYKASQHIFMIDSLLDLSSQELSNIKEGSVNIIDDHLQYDIKQDTVNLI